MALTRRGRNTLVIVAGAVAVLLVGGGIAYAAIFAGDDPEPVVESPTATPTATVTPTPTPTPTPEAAEIPTSTPMHAVFDGWTGADSGQVADIKPQIGDAASGRMSAYIDAPRVKEPAAALTVEVPVTPGERYDVSAQLRQGTTQLHEVDGEIVVGDTSVPFGELNGAWSEVTGEFTAPEGSDVATVQVRINGSVTALGVDDLTLTPASGGDNVVPNASFEQVTGDWGILNQSLILREKGAAMAVSLPDGDASWSVTTSGGDTVAEGTETVSEGFARIPLEGVTQGYYTFSVTDSAGQQVSTPFGVVDFQGTNIAADDRFGVATHVDQDWYVDAADAIRSVGFGLARNDVLWEQNETTPGQYSFSSHYTTEFGKFSSHGIDLLGIVNYGNPLYDGGNTPASPEAVDAFGRYAAAIARTFDVAGLEVFNEFNHDRFQNGSCGSAPECYRPLIQSTEKYVAEVDPELPIVVGSTANYDGAWFDGLWATGAIENSDVMSFHPYNKYIYDTPESLSSVVGEANDHMQSIGGSILPIWITEFGWTTGAELGQQVSREMQAERLLRAELTSLDYGVQKYFWYDLTDDSTDPNNHEGNFGMFEQRRSGVAAQPPKPAAFAQALLIDLLEGRPQADGVDAGDGVKTASFGEGDDMIHAAWSIDGERQATIEASGPVEVTTMWGSTERIEPEGDSVSVTVGSSPVFIEEIQ